jgi:LmbE family N-acetylglucosaminyl deacetylase
MVLDDGSATHPHSRSHPPEVLARLREQETRAAVAHLGLPPARLLLVGLMDSAIPTHGPVFEAVVRAMALVMWARDCNLVCAPSPNTADPGHLAAHHMARAVVAETGVAYLGYAPLPSTHEATSGMGWRLDISPHLPAKAAAIATHASQQGKIVQDDPTGRHWTPTLLSASRQPYEVYLPD